MSLFAHRINPSFTVVLFQNATGRTEVGFFVEWDQSGSLETRTEQRMIHWPYTGPHSVPMNICRELTERNRNTERALTCHAWGDVMPHPCTTCEEDQGRCVTLRNKFNNACSNCILKGRDVSCEWRTRYELDSDEEYDYLPPTRAGARGTGAPAAIPATRAKRAGRGDYPQRKRRRAGKTSGSNAELRFPLTVKFVYLGSFNRRLLSCPNIYCAEGTTLKCTNFLLYLSTEIANHVGIHAQTIHHWHQTHSFEAVV